MNFLLTFQKCMQNNSFTNYITNYLFLTTKRKFFSLNCSTKISNSSLNTNFLNYYMNVCHETAFYGTWKMAQIKKNIYIYRCVYKQGILKYHKHKKYEKAEKSILILWFCTNSHKNIVYFAEYFQSFAEHLSFLCFFFGKKIIVLGVWIILFIFCGDITIFLFSWLRRF